MSEQSTQAICQFYRLYENAPLPRRADLSADGMIPTRGFRHCVVSSMASAYGFYMYPPMNFALLWHGRTVFWTYDDADKWYPLGTAQYPGFRRSFRRNAPERLKLLAPTCLAASRDKAMVQIFLGYTVRTAPGYALLVRAPANIPRAQDYEQFEGILQTENDRYPIITNIVLNEKDCSVQFSTEYPIVQLQPVRHECYVRPSFEVGEITNLTDEDWNSYERIAKANTDRNRKPGRYAAEVRKKLRGVTGDPAVCPIHGIDDKATTAISDPLPGEAGKVSVCPVHGGGAQAAA